MRNFSEDMKYISVQQVLKRLNMEELVSIQRSQRLNIFEVLMYGFPSPPDCLRRGFRALPKPASTHIIGLQDMCALDCEMVCTIDPVTRYRRNELARVSVVDVNCEVVLDLLVKPDNEIVDYLTPFSGLTAEIMKDAKLTLKEVQDRFCQIFDASTIFVGHSLEQDLLALKFVHLNVIDTSVLYIRECGGDKPKLKLLSAMFLNLLIQSGKDGHDSVIDAKCAMKLVLYNLLPAAEFDRMFACRGKEATEFLVSHEKFLEIRVIPTGENMSWLNKASAYLSAFVEGLQKPARGICGHIDLDLCPYYFFQPLPSKDKRLDQRRGVKDTRSQGICFYIGMQPRYRQRVGRLYADDDLRILRDKFNMLGLQFQNRFLRRSELPDWVLGQEHKQRFHQNGPRFADSFEAQPPKNDIWISTVVLPNRSRDTRDWTYITEANSSFKPRGRFAESGEIRQPRKSTDNVVRAQVSYDDEGWRYAHHAKEHSAWLAAFIAQDYTEPTRSDDSTTCPSEQTSLSSSSASSEQVSLSSSSASICSEPFSPSPSAAEVASCPTLNLDLDSLKNLNPNALEFKQHASTSQLNPWAGEFILGSSSGPFGENNNAVNVSANVKPLQVECKKPEFFQDGSNKENEPKYENQSVRSSKRQAFLTNADLNAKENLHVPYRQKGKHSFTKRRRNRYKNKDQRSRAKRI